MEEIKRKKDADLHIRCYKEDKEYVERRAKDGFGSEHNSKTNFVLYALRHVDDASPVNLEEADALIKCIRDNRQTLYGIYVSLGNIVQEMNAISNNINQIARQINTTMKKARAEGESAKETTDRLQRFSNAVSFALYNLETKMNEWNQQITPMRQKVSTALNGENNILSRCLVFPKVGATEKRAERLLHMIQDFKKEYPEYDYRYMMLDGFVRMLWNSTKTDIHKNKEG